MNPCGGPAGCPAGTQCNVNTGQCESDGICGGPAGCPAGTQCNVNTGQCDPDGNTSNCTPCDEGNWQLVYSSQQACFTAWGCGGNNNNGGGGGGGGGMAPMGMVLCMIISWFYGNLGKGLAIIAVSMLGVGAMLGKTSWGMALTVGVGIAVIFGAAPLVIAMGINAGVICPAL